MGAVHEEEPLCLKVKYFLATTHFQGLFLKNAKKLIWQLNIAETKWAVQRES